MNRLDRAVCLCGLADVGLRGFGFWRGSGFSRSGHAPNRGREAGKVRRCDARNRVDFKARRRMFHW
jgi:hypothetical protein